VNALKGLTETALGFADIFGVLAEIAEIAQ
jgi:hypothetical protein